MNQQAELKECFRNARILNTFTSVIVIVQRETTIESKVKVKEEGVTSAGRTVSRKEFTEIYFYSRSG